MFLLDDFVFSDVFRSLCMSGLFCSTSEHYMLIARAGHEDSPSGPSMLQDALMSTPAAPQALLPLNGPFLNAASNMQMYAGGMSDQVGAV